MRGTLLIWDIFVFQVRRGFMNYSRNCNSSVDDAAYYSECFVKYECDVFASRGKFSPRDGRKNFLRILVLSDFIVIWRNCHLCLPVILIPQFRRFLCWKEWRMRRKNCDLCESNFLLGAIVLVKFSNFWLCCGVTSNSCSFFFISFNWIRILLLIYFCYMRGVATDRICVRYLIVYKYFYNTLWIIS